MPVTSPGNSTCISEFPSFIGFTLFFTVFIRFLGFKTWKNKFPQLPMSWQARRAKAKLRRETQWWPDSDVWDGVHLHIRMGHQVTWKDARRWHDVGTVEVMCSHTSQNQAAHLLSGRALRLITLPGGVWVKERVEDDHIVTLYFRLEFFHFLSSVVWSVVSYEPHNGVIISHIYHMVVLLFTWFYSTIQMYLRMFPVHLAPHLLWVLWCVVCQTLDSPVACLSGTWEKKVAIVRVKIVPKLNVVIHFCHIRWLEWTRGGSL